MTIQQISAPTVEPVSLSEAKMHLRVTGNDEDSLIESLIVAARESAEHKTGRVFIAQTYRVALDTFPSSLEFVRFPARTVLSVKYRDADGVLQTVDPANYIIDLWTDPITFRPASGMTWPVTAVQSNAVEIMVRSGYAVQVTVDANANTTTVPEWEPLAANYPVRFSNVGGALPNPLKPKTDYYIESVVSPGVYTLTTMIGGSAMDLTDAGVGATLLGEVPWAIRAWILSAVGTLYSNRENVVVERSVTVSPMQFVDGLLDRYMTYSAA